MSAATQTIPTFLTVLLSPLDENVGSSLKLKKNTSFFIVPVP